MNICIVSMMKESIDTILAFIAYHKNIGVNKFILYIDEKDSAPIEKLSAIDGVSAFLCDDSLEVDLGETSKRSLPDRQKFYADQGLQLAREKNYDWITHIDCDELIYPKGDLRAILESCDTDLMTYRIYEAIPSSFRSERPYSATSFRRYWDARKRVLLARIATLDRPFFRGKFFRGHTASKTIVRITNNLLHLRVHVPLLAISLPNPITDDLILLHFDSISTEHWLRKWSYPIRHYSFENHPKEREDMAGIARKALNTSPFRQNLLFLRLYMMGPYSKWVLKTLKLLTDVKIPIESFNHSDISNV